MKFNLFHFLLYGLLLFGLINQCYGKKNLKNSVKQSKSVITENNEVIVGQKPRLPHNLIVNQYDIQIQPYFPAPGVDYDASKNYTFDGYTKISFQMLSTETSISVDVYNMSIYYAQLFVGDNRLPLSSTSFNSTTNRLTITPIFFLKANTNYTLVFNYTAKILSYEYGGLFASTYTYPNGTQGTVYATHFETFVDQISHYDPSIGSSRVFPSFDDPHFKAVFNLTLIYPSSMKAIANTIEPNPIVIGNGWSQSTFPLTQRQSSYLVAFAIGDLVSKSTTTKDGFLIRTWSWKGTEDFMDYALNQSKTCVEVMTTFTGINLPFDKLDVLAVPYFTAGGMENWGLIINQADFVLFNPKEDIPARQISGADVNCHEIAHQWFGDLVTNDWWSDIMLHESFAAFFEDYAIDQGWPKQSVFWDSYYIYSDVEDGFYSDTYNSEPIITKNGDFGGPVYSKGSSLLRMLQKTIGQEVFQKGLQNYLNKYKFSTANHHQLFEAMTETASKYPQVVDWCKKPMNITRFMDPWFEMPHYPELIVSYDRNTNAYIIDQQPFLGYKNLDDNYAYSWPVPFYAKQLNGGGVKQYWSAPSYPCFGVFDDEESDVKPYSKSVITIPSTSSDALLVNFDSTAFARVHYDDYSFNQIIDSLQSGQISFTDSSMVRLILDEIAIVERDRQLGKRTSYVRPLKMISATLNNSGTKSTAVFLAANQMINSMISLSVDSYEFDLFNKYFGNVLKSLYNRTGWQKNTDDWNSLYMNQYFLPLAVKLNILDAQTQALNRFSNVLSKCQNSDDYISCNNIDPSIREAVYCGAAIKGGSSVVRQLYMFWLSAGKTYSFKYQEQQSLSKGMACTMNPDSIQTYIEWTLLGRMPVSDVMNLALNPLAGDIIYEYMVNSFSAVALKENGFYYALNAMTKTWITPNRVQKLKDLGKILAQQFTPDNLEVFINVYNSVARRSGYALADRLEITRFFYDEYAPNGGWPWMKRLPSNVLVPMNYELSVLPYIPNKSFKYLTEKNFTFDANSTVTLKTLQDLTSITINSHRHMIASFSAKYFNTTTVIPISSFTRDYDNAFLTLNFNTKVPAGSIVQLSFNYSGFIFEAIINEGNIANFDYLKQDNRKSWIFTTDFEAGPSTRSLIPCFDEPSYKAKWQVTVIYPGEFTALSNTLEDSVVNYGNGLMQTKFKQTVPMSSYLLALTIGHYSSLQGMTTVDGKLVRIWTWTGMEQYADKALQFVINTIDHLSSTLDQSLPLEKFDVLALPQYSGYSSGAMENFGLVIAGYLDVLFNPDYTTTKELVNLQNTVSHEITHHWFGDYVTLDWWTHLFLNEGFATYWPPRTLKATQPEQSSICDFTIFETQEYSLLHDAISYASNPVVPDNSLIGGNYPLFGNAVYNKGSSMIYTLAAVFKSDKYFNEALHNYLVSHGLSNSDDLSLWRSMDNIAKKYNVKGWNNNVLSATKMMLPLTMQWSTPMLRVIQNINGLSLAQMSLAKSSELPESNYNYQWIIPYKKLTSNGISTDNYLTTIRANINANNNDFTIINPKRETYMRVLYDDHSWKPIYDALTTNLTVIDEVTRAQLLVDSFAQVKSQQISWERFLNLTTYLKNEKGFIPWQFAARNDNYQGFINYFLDNFKYHPVYSNLKTYLSSISDGLTLGKLVNTDNWSQNILNSSVLELRCMLGDKKCLSLTATAYNQFISQCSYPSGGTGKCNPASPDYRSTQFCYGLMQNHDSFSNLRKLVDFWLQNPKSNDYFMQDLEAIIRGLSCTSDSSLLNQIITDALNGKIPSQSLTYVGKQDNTGVIYSYLKNNAKTVMNSALFRQFITSMTDNWSTDTQLKNIQSFDWPSKLTADQQNIINQTVSRINNLRSWLATDGITIQKWINNFVST